MADFDYVKSQKTADALLKKFGKMGQIVRTTSSGGTGWQPGQTSEDAYNMLMVCLPANTSKISDFDIKTDENLVLSNLRFFISSTKMKRQSGSGPDSIVPEPTDIVKFNGETLAILGCTPLNPAGTPILYKFAARV